MATYLVTGGAGFIGSHLVDRLIGFGHRVRVLDDLSTGRLENLHPRAELTTGDVAEHALVRRMMDGVDGCFHLAAVASVQQSIDDWLGTHRTNLTGTIAVLDAARARLTPVVYASSAAIYGDAKTCPLGEESPARPISAYGADKLGCELHARTASLLHGVPTVGLRFFNVYGPRQDARSSYSGVISIFADRMRAGLPIAIYGDGRQVRDFVFVGDVVEALLKAQAWQRPEARIFCVCTGRPSSIRDLALEVSIAAGRPATIEHRPARGGDIRISLGDPRQAAMSLGFTARTSLRTGLQAMFAAQARLAA